ncbi:MAG TPA: hypothetical protein VG649_12925, partial [Candidatus Angelobacter sp.]|nr:hypothetical protein [Candidatus Angelobacter sp.]
MRIVHSFAAWIFLFVALPAFCLANQGDSQGVIVQESKMQLVLAQQPRLELPFVNNTGKPLGGHVNLEILREDDKIVASKEADI